MATKKKAPTTALAKWDEELAKQAEVAAAMEANAGGGQFFSLKGGILSWQDMPLRNNEAAVIILGHVFENVYFEEAYDPDSPSSPTCFAFAAEEKSLAPHANVIEVDQAQAEKCADCPHNAWGSAEKGRGKACRNSRRLALLSAGQFAKDGTFEIADVETFEQGAIGFMKLPVTSVKGFASWVKQTAALAKRPPFGVVARIAVVPDPKTQFRVTFEVIENVAPEYIEVVMKKREEAMATIDFPYQLDRADEQPAKKSTKKAAKKSRRY